MARFTPVAGRHRYRRGYIAFRGVVGKYLFPETEDEDDTAPKTYQRDALLLRSPCGMPSQTQPAMQSPTQSFSARSHDAVIRVYDEPGNVIETHEHAGQFKEP
jgi:hypothetical protein